MKTTICTILALVGIFASGALADTLGYDFEGTLQGWTNGVAADENMTVRQANDGTWGTRIGSHDAGGYLLCG